MPECFATVIVPVYNGERYLRKCIDSICAQSFSEWELLLVDDGSEDRSGALCEEYAGCDRRIRVLHLPRGGVRRARNAALAQAQGRWVLFADADDVLHPNLLEVLWRTDEREKPDIIAWNYKTFEQEAALQWTSASNAKSTRCSGEQLLWRSISPEGDLGGYVWNKAFRRSYLCETRFNEEICILEDKLFICQCLVGQRLAGNIVHVDAPLYGYRQNPEGVCRQAFSDAHITMLTAWDCMLDSLSGWPVDEEQMKKRRRELKQLICIFNKKQWLNRAMRGRHCDLLDHLWGKYAGGGEDGGWPIKLALYRLMMELGFRLRR